MTKMFGTNGVRGVVNKDMNVQLALQMGKAVGAIFPGNIAIANDTRDSCAMIVSAVSAGLMSVGCNVFKLGMMPTPSLQYYVKTHDGISCGIMITASHNPPEFNGIKVIAPDGTEASPEQEAAIENKYDETIAPVQWEKTGYSEEISGADIDYVDAVIKKLDVDLIKNAGLTVVLDCSNGASCFTSPLLMKRIGVRAVTLNGTPQGEFPGHPSEPTEDHLTDLKKLVVDVGANLGIAHDGDADRCVFVDEKGNYVPGDKTLAILGKRLASVKRGSTVVTPVATSSVVEENVASVKGKVVYTAVGSPIVARAMMDDGAVFGGEENGGLIFPDHQYCRDGAMAAGRMLECIVGDGPLSKQVDELPKFYMEKRKIVCPNELKDSVVKYIDAHTKGVKKSRRDGIKLLFDNGWVLVRPSGTEPIFRVYSESKYQNDAVTLADTYVTMVNGFLNSA